MLSVTTLFSSSKGNSICLCSDKTKILIDAGMACRNLEYALSDIGVHASEIAAILITHEHIDHIKGAGAFSRRYGVPIYAAPKLWEKFDGFGNISPGNKVPFDYGLKIGDLSVDFFKIYHDAIQPVGITVSNGEHKIGVCTDTGKCTPGMIKALHNADALVFESNHDYQMLLNGPYPFALKRRISGEFGHLSNEEAGYALLKIIGDRTKHIILAHLSEENNRPALALDTVRDILHRGNIADVQVYVAPPNAPSQTIVLD